jgi:hypothetical protein
MLLIRVFFYTVGTVLDPTGHSYYEAVKTVPVPNGVNLIE